jgi:hypothetical protein
MRSSARYVKDFPLSIATLFMIILTQQISDRYDKNFNYPKHHTLIHLSSDLRRKAATDNYTTRPGEGFQQEVQQAYDQTNFRDVESQVM